jgi:tetratricopeptide (TPR) repeat protein
MTQEMKNQMPRASCERRERTRTGDRSRLAPHASRLALHLLLSTFCVAFFWSLGFASPLAGQGSVSRGPIANPRDPELEKAALHNLEVAHYYLKKKKWTAAEGRLQDVIRDHPDFSQMPEVFYLLGDVYRQTKRRELAVELYSRVVEEFPKTEFAERARGRLKEMGAQPTKTSGTTVPPTI